MSLFRNTADLKLFADIHKQTDWATLKPYVDQAESTYIIPLLSQAQYAVFYSPIHAASNAAKSFEEIFTDELQLECFQLIARSLANYTLYEAFPFLNTAVGDTGVMQQQSKEGTSTAAAQWRYESRRAAHLNVADNYADKMLAFLELHKAVFTPWAGSTSFTINKELFIDDSIKLSQYLGTGESRRAYLSLRPYIRLAEKQYIVTAIGQDTYDQIKAQMKTNPATISAENQKLIPMIEEALAWSAYYDALPFIAIRINGDGVQVVSRNDGINNRNSASLDEKKEARAQAGRFMDSFLGSLRKYMDDNMDTYALYMNSLMDDSGQIYRRRENRKNSGHFSV